MKHTNRTRQDAIRKLIMNLGDIDKTHEQTGIPKPTLFRWKKRLGNYQDEFFYWEYTTRSQIVRERYERVRDKLLVEVENMMDRLVDVPPTGISQYVHAIARLADRIEKIENLLYVTGQYEIVVKLDSFFLRADEPDELADEYDDEDPPFDLDSMD